MIAEVIAAVAMFTAAFLLAVVAIDWWVRSGLWR